MPRFFKTEKVSIWIHKLFDETNIICIPLPVVYHFPFL